MKKLLILFFFIILSNINLFGKTQNSTIDSLINIIENKAHDTIIINSLVEYDMLIYFSDDKLSLKLNQKIEELCKRNLKKKLNQKDKLFFNKKLAYAYNSFGLYFKDVGDISKAVEYYSKSRKLFEEVKSDIGLASYYNNMAQIYSETGDNTKALEYIKKNIVLHKKIGHPKKIISSLCNLGNIYQNLEKYNDAEKCFLESLRLCDSIDYPVALATILNNLGNIYVVKADELLEKGNFQSDKYYKIALEYYQKGYNKHIQIQDTVGAAISQMNMAAIYSTLNQTQKGIPLAEGAMRLAKSINSKREIVECGKILYMLYKKSGNTTKALEIYELTVEISESLSSEENERELYRQEYKYSYEKQAAKDSVKNAEEKKVKDAEIAEQKAMAENKELELVNKRNQQYYMIAGLFLLVAFLIFVYNRFRVTNAQKKIIEAQKAIVETAHEQLEEKNKEVMDSIKYAKRIQSAILPPDKLIKEYLPNHFILYKPKDIVAGDFYWFEKKGNQIFIAAADCTGHGVPGALVSVVCHGALNRAVREYNLSDPSKILDKTREIIIQEFEKSEEDVKDGMDISLVNFEIINTEISNLNWSGANNPLWIIRNSELIDFKPDKQPIGKYADNNPFTNHEISLQKNDMIYLFTDGYSDQFGGEKAKKFKYSNLQKLLIEIAHFGMEKQSEILNQRFQQWKGNLEQVDDVCIIGIRI